MAKRITVNHLLTYFLLKIIRALLYNVSELKHLWQCNPYAPLCWAVTGHEPATGYLLEQVCSVAARRLSTRRSHFGSVKKDQQHIQQLWSHCVGSSGFVDNVWVTWKQTTELQRPLNGTTKQTYCAAPSLRRLSLLSSNRTSGEKNGGITSEKVEKGEGTGSSSMSQTQICLPSVFTGFMPGERKETR